MSKISVVRKTAVLMVIILLSMSALTSFAAEADDIISVKWINIDTADDLFAVDSLNGIPAYYDGTGSGTYYQCAELVRRYYSELYGVSSIISYPECPPSSQMDNYNLTDSPKVGDIVYWPAVRRGKSYQHYALVKEVRSDSLVLIEQNWQWNGQASLNRTVKFPSQNYDIWTYGGSSAPTHTDTGDAANPSQAPAQGSLCEPPASPVPEMSDIVYDHFSSALFPADAESGSNGGVAESEIYFHDLDDKHMVVRNAVNFLAANKIVSGNGDKKFNPDSPITRAEAAAILVRILNKEKCTYTEPFDDIQEGCWYYDIANTVKQYGIMGGFEDNTFRGDEIISKGQIVTLAARTLRAEKGYAFTGNSEKVLGVYPDAEEIDAWALEDIALARSVGLIAPTSSGEFGFSHYISRGDVAVIMCLLYQLI